MSIATSFTALGVGLPMIKRSGEGVVYSVSGTFVGTVVLERSQDGGISWQTVLTATGSASGTHVVELPTGQTAAYRFRCSAFTSGTIVTSIADAADVAQSFVDDDGVAQLQIVNGGVVLPGTLAVTGAATLASTVAVTGAVTLAAGLSVLDGSLTVKNTADPTKVVKLSAASVTTATTRTVTIPDSTGVMVLDSATQTLTNKTLTSPALASPTITGTLTRTAQKRIHSTGARVGSGVGFLLGVALTSDMGLLSTLPAAATAAKLIVPISGLKVGDTITAFHLIGQIESAGGAVTLDADLRVLTAAAADVTDASLGSITQIAVTAYAAITVANSAKTLVTPEVVAADKTYYVLLTGTTAALTDIALQGVAVTVTES